MQITDTILDDLENDPQELEALKKSLEQKRKRFVVWAVIALLLYLLTAAGWAAEYYTETDGFKGLLISLAVVSTLCSLLAYRYYIAANQENLHIFFFSDSQPLGNLPRFVPQLYSVAGFALTVAIGWAWGAGFEQDIHYLAGAMGLFVSLQLFLLATAENFLKNYRNILSLRHHSPQAALSQFWIFPFLCSLLCCFLVYLGESGAVSPNDAAPYVWGHTTALAMLVLAALGYFSLNWLLAAIIYLRHRRPRAVA